MQIDDYIKKIISGETEVSTKTLKEVIGKLMDAQKVIQKRETEEEEYRKRCQREAEEEAYAEQQNEPIPMETVSVSEEIPSGWVNPFKNDSRAMGIHAENIPDALLYSLFYLGKTDLEYMAEITGRDFKTIISALEGSIYQNPETWDECFFRGWETADAYLSGNLTEKLREAERANRKYNGYFARNVEALQNIIPKARKHEEIYISLGSPWVPADIIDSFITHILGPNYYSRNLKGRTRHDDLTGSWEIPMKNRYQGNALSYSTYGTKRVDALTIIERTLNQKNITVTDTYIDFTSKTGLKTVINKPETILATEKQEKIIAEFRSWVWADEKRRKRLLDIYNTRYGSVRKRHFDGSFLNFPGLSSAVHLFKYQKNAVARILFSKNTLLAHDVGSGKTYIMIAAAMELRRMGLSKKNMIVVPNNIVGQWESIFLDMYPEAKLLTVEPKNFTVKKRNDVMAQIRDNDYDAVIIAYSCFDMISVSKEYSIMKLEEELREIDYISRDTLRDTGGLRSRKKKIYGEIKKLRDKNEKQKLSIPFESLGINRLFVDEAHNYKNVPFETKIENTRGITGNGSAKCTLLMDKVRCVQDMNNGGGVVLASGTPITNSITDAYLMQCYLQNQELSDLCLSSFDAWVGMFAEKVTEFEIDVDTSSYKLTTRFSRFHNLPELTAILSGVADFHVMENEEDLPDFKGYRDILVKKSSDLADYLFKISQRAEAIRRRSINRSDDNMLLVTTDGRKAALDIRLVNPEVLPTVDSKIHACCENVLRIYNETSSFLGTQLIFCDISVPKEKFNIYDEMKRLLMEKGIPEKDIAFIYDAVTEAKREELFRDMRLGKKRILLGSTLKLGLGVNIQNKLFALHHLDVPWRPSDMVQREGRILRQGNTNKEIFIYRYITEGSFDAYSWQLLETKQRFISSILSGSLSERSGYDVDNTVLNYAEVKALAVGNSQIKRRVELSNELNRLISLSRKISDAKATLSAELDALPTEIKNVRDHLNKCTEDLEFLSSSPVKYTEAQKRAIRNDIFKGLSDNTLVPEERPVAEYRGFNVILPANMVKEQAFVWVCRSDRYYVEMGDFNRGVLVRIDNFFDSLETRKKDLRRKYDSLLQQKKRLADEIANSEDYGERIALIEKELKSVDAELGMKK